MPEKSCVLRKDRITGGVVSPQIGKPRNALIGCHVGHPRLQRWLVAAIALLPCLLDRLLIVLRVRPGRADFEEIRGKGSLNGARDDAGVFRAREIRDEDL